MLAPHGVYPCRGDDRWIAIAVRDNVGWSRLCEVLGNPEWAKAARWNDAQGRREGAIELDAHLATSTAGRDGDELMIALQARGVSAGLVQTAADVVDSDPQLAHRGHWQSLDHAEMGRALYNSPPYRFSRTPIRLRGPAPLLGEHTREVLRDVLGVDDEEYQRLEAEDVLR